MFVPLKNHFIEYFVLSHLVRGDRRARETTWNSPRR